MNNLKFNIKDRKTLGLVLGLVLVCVFTLTIAYAALNTILTIQGNAEITASTWDIHLENPVVKSGSATTEVPTITSGKTLTFNTTLNMPGDFYEFTVDVVNSGSIDAMIDKVTKTPELTADQAKYLKYEVSYANGEGISAKQNIAAGVTMPIKVRVEYRSDLSNGDLPTGQVVLNLSLVLDYIQSDGSGSNVKDNGVQLVFADGNINDIGTIVTIGSEQFYTIGTEGNNINLLSMYNLYVGGEFNSSTQKWTAYGVEATGMQNENMRGYVLGQGISRGVTTFSSDSQKGTNYNSYEGSIVNEYVDSYKNILENNIGVDVIEARLITHEELTNEKIGCTNSSCNNAPKFIYYTTYWTGKVASSNFIWRVSTDGGYSGFEYNFSTFGVRPVIVISKDYFN